MRLNNKGFAITAILYGLLLLFVILVSSYLMVLSARKNRVDNIIEDIDNNYKEKLKNKNDDNSIGSDDSENNIKSGDIDEDDTGDE